MQGPFLAILTLLTSFGSTHPHQQTAEVNLEEIRAFRQISEQLATSGQITYEQIPDIKAAGFEVVVNLAVADDKRNGSEGFLVVKEGMSYVHIPVLWKEPSLRHLEMFFDIIESNKDRKVYVHCFANMRVSVFVYLYRTLKLGTPTDEALEDLHAIWDPSEQEQWVRFIADAEAKYNNQTTPSRER
jgi:protein tyrosine phosphatase (PTP) superfamily phosphohydrolase (DUF442 family)